MRSRKTRVLFLAPDIFGPPGGIARHARMVCSALTDAGLELSAVALHDSGRGHCQAAAVYPDMRYQACEGSHRSFMVEALRTARDGTDLVVVEHPNLSPLGWMAAQLAGARFLVFGHGIDIWDPLPPVRRWALRQADRIICVSRFTAEHAVKSNGLALHKLRILYNCLDPQLTFMDKLSGGCASRSLLTVSRLSRGDTYKGHQLVIRSLPSLIDTFPGLVYHVVGDGAHRCVLERLAAETGVRHAVRFHGTVSDRALACHYASATVFVMPSRSEGFGLVFLEAMAQGTPVIGGAIDAACEVIVDGETGYVVDPTSVDAFRGATSRLLADERLRRQMGQAAIERVAGNFTFERFQTCLLSYVGELEGV